MNRCTDNGRILFWLIRDTFRQTTAEGVAVLALAVSLAAALACATLVVMPAPDGSGQEVRALFGLVRAHLPGDRDAAVRTVQASVAGVAAGGVGVLLMLLWTAAVLPRFLEPSAVLVLLAKPVPRWQLLLGKCMGVLAFVSVQLLVFLGGLWLVLGWRTSWEPAFLLCLPLVLLQFLVFFSFSAMLAVTTRSPTASIFGTVVFWLLCWAANTARHAVRSVPDLHGAASSLGGGVEVSYWLLPKPLDLQLILNEALAADLPSGGLIDLSVLAERGLWAPALSVLASVLFALVVFAVAVYEFHSADY
jgi:hypothetical protein